MYYLNIKFVYSYDEKLAATFSIRIYNDPNDNLISSMINNFNYNFNRNEIDGLYTLEINHKPINLLLDSMSNSDIKSMKVKDYLDLIADNILSDEFKDKTTGFDIFKFIINNSNIESYFINKLFIDNNYIFVNSEPVMIFDQNKLNTLSVLFNIYEDGMDNWYCFVSNIKNALTPEFLELYLSDIDSSDEDSRDIVLYISNDTNEEDIKCKIILNFTDLY